jgi:large conductance mechanosensitive channel
MKEFLNEFKAFAMKGNVIELAIAVVIGGAFGKIVTSFANDIIMPPLGVLMGEVDFSDKALILKAATDEAAAITLNYGQFINTIVQFLIIALAIFIVVRQLNKLYKKEEEKKEEKPKAPPEDVVLLTEIRDLLAQKKK